ncbi:MAG: hypothetical protein IJD67_04645 [Clostridia bacterium]|nr:hypothetical protein [Clostridia bacterium]
MNSRVKSAVVCALLLCVSLVGMRYGRDENYLPYKEYGEVAKEVFYSCGSDIEAGALSYYSANNIINASEKKEREASSTPDTSGSQVLPPVITPPDGIEVFDEAGT